MTRQQIAALAYTDGFDATMRKLVNPWCAMENYNPHASLTGEEPWRPAHKVRPRWRAAYQRSYRAGVRGAQRSYQRQQPAERAVA